MAGRPQKFDEQQVLDKATDLFWSRGYEATSLEDLKAQFGSRCRCPCLLPA